MASRHVVVAHVASNSNPDKTYAVSCNAMNEAQGSLADWECGCIGWCRHTPRRDCSHIKAVKLVFERNYRESGVVLTDAGCELRPIYAVVASLKQVDEG